MFMSFYERFDHKRQSSKYNSVKNTTNQRSLMEIISDTSFAYAVWPVPEGAH